MSNSQSESYNIGILPAHPQFPGADALAVNRESVLLYWQIGGEILKRQQEQGWGAKVIKNLAKDLKREFPDISGFSRSNLLYMRAFAEAYPDEQIVQQVVGQFPWGHNVRILESTKDPSERSWDVRQTIENGWSRNVLVHQTESDLYHRMGEAITNFDRVLPPAQSDLAQQLLKDPYNFSFLSLSKEVQERELERSRVDHIRDFLLELGVGFAFLGSQYPLEVSGKKIALVRTLRTRRIGKKPRLGRCSDSPRSTELTPKSATLHMATAIQTRLALLPCAAALLRRH